MFRNRITALALTVATTAAVAAPVAAQASTPHVRHACANNTYVYVHAGKGFQGTVSKGDAIQIKRYSSSKTWAHGFVRGHVNRNGWVKTSALCR